MLSGRANRAAGDTIPVLPKVNSLQALMRLRPKRGAEWGVLAFSLNRDMIQPDGTLDDLHGVVFSLGSFDDLERASEHAKNIIEITGHTAVIPVRYGYPLRLSPNFDPKAVQTVPVDLKGKIIQLESAQYKREREEFEKRVRQEREMMQEAEEETNPNSIEHFKRQCFLAIKNRSKFQLHSKEADTAWADYKKREAAVREHYGRHPEHEAQWLKYLKEKLKERGELSLYYAMREAYRELRDEILGLVPSSSEEDVPTVELETLDDPSGKSNPPIVDDPLSNSNPPIVDDPSSKSNPPIVDDPSSKSNPSVLETMQETSNISQPVSSDECSDGVCFTTFEIIPESLSEDDIMSPAEFAKHTEATAAEAVATSPIPFSDEELIASPVEDIVLTPPKPNPRGHGNRPRGRRGGRR